MPVFYFRGFYYSKYTTRTVTCHVFCGGCVNILSKVVDVTRTGFSVGA